MTKKQWLQVKIIMHFQPLYVPIEGNSASVYTDLIEHNPCLPWARSGSVILFTCFWFREMARTFAGNFGYSTTASFSRCFILVSEYWNVKIQNLFTFKLQRSLWMRISSTTMAGFFNLKIRQRQRRKVYNNIKARKLIKRLYFLTNRNIITYVITYS